MPVWQPPVGTRTEVEHVTGLHQDNLKPTDPKSHCNKEAGRKTGTASGSQAPTKRKRSLPQSLSNQVPKSLKPLRSDLLPHLSSLNAGPLKSHQLQGCPHSVQRPCGDLVDRIARLQLHLGAQGQVASDTHTLTRAAGWWFICSSAPCLPWGRDDIFSIKAGGRTLAPRVQLALHRPRVQGKSGPPTSYLAK